MEKNSKEVQEDFCPACVAVPLAFAGAGAAGVGMNKKGGRQKYKKMLLYIGVPTAIISILVAVYFLWIKKCEECGNP